MMSGQHDRMPRSVRLGIRLPRPTGARPMAATWNQANPESRETRRRSLLPQHAAPRKGVAKIIWTCDSGDTRSQ
ncbi:protein of unknown function [Azospirillum lipoferum 4B]|uniref:Uncharacterized protein n=1 Tax=Azospirillum lipoferum (strain 4B) TaxID=862719 RepID=G7Z669_AZOL4|nr:protein of unknown function [Azospirillum lipoferum 4B]